MTKIQPPKRLMPDNVRKLQKYFLFFFNLKTKMLIMIEQIVIIIGAKLHHIILHLPMLLPNEETLCSQLFYFLLVRVINGMCLFNNLFRLLQ